MAGQGGKAKREKQRKEKATLEVDYRFAEPASRGSDRGRGRGRGEGRGEGRGDFRGRGRGRGDGFRGRGDSGFRGGQRGGRSVNVDDTSSFPSLGGS